METVLKKTFAALEVRNFRLFIFGQGLSLCGTWMQTIAMSWLVLQLTHSGTQLGLIVAAQFLPILLFGAWGGVVADRYNKRKILYVTQSISAILALILGILVITHSIQLWMIYSLAVCLGFVAVIDNPTRQSFLIEMVGPKHLQNAVTLNSTLVNAARVIGPSLAGFVIAVFSVGTCFIVNAASFIAVLVALFLMRQSEIHVSPKQPREKGLVRAGFRYVWSQPKLKSTLIMMFIIGTFAYEFPVFLPLFATVTLHGNATTYSLMMAATGVGADVGGLYTAGRPNTRELQLVWSAALFGLSIIVAALMPSFAAALVVLLFVGGLSVVFLALGNTTLQLNSDPKMRGRVMALWSVAFLGTTPIGGPIIGYISDHTNPRVGMIVGGLAGIIAAIIGYYIYKHDMTKKMDDIALSTD